MGLGLWFVTAVPLLGEQGRRGSIGVLGRKIQGWTQVDTCRHHGRLLGRMKSCWKTPTRCSLWHLWYAGFLLFQLCGLAGLAGLQVGAFRTSRTYNYALQVVQRLTMSLP